MRATAAKQWESLVSAGDPTAFENLAQAFLYAVSALFSVWVLLRNWGYSERVFSVRAVRAPVVSIGNVSLGGTGKTEIVIWCARRLAKIGKTAAVLSRGYGRRGSEEARIVSDGKNILAVPEDSGDEPALMARSLPGVAVIVGADRAAAAQWAMERFNPDVLLLDDGFQHRKLERNLDVVCLDERMLEAPRLFPAGFLREPAHSLSRAQFVLLKTRNEEVYQAQFKKAFGFFPSKPTAVFTYRPENLVDNVTGGLVPVSTLTKRPVFAFSGIANPRDFERMLKDSGADLAALRSFPDHHRFTPREIADLVADAREKNAMLVTTEKDRMRIPADAPVWSVQVSVQWLRGEDEFFDRIGQTLAL